MSAGIGVGYYPQGEDIDADQLLRQAVVYRANPPAQNRYHVFDTEKDRTLRTRHGGFDSIENALPMGSFCFITNLRSTCAPVRCWAPQP